MSQLVNDFLQALPVDEELPQEANTPGVRRILGIAEGSRGVDEYHEHLVDKYGR